MTDVNHFVLFTLDEQKYALRLAVVERVVHAVEVTPLPKAPEVVLGIINLQGRIIPVFDIRKRFCHAGREISLHDHLIIARTAKRTVALAVDSVTDVVEPLALEVVAVQDILPSTEYVDGVAKRGDGLILIHDLDRFLCLDEEEALDGAMLQG